MDLFASSLNHCCGVYFAPVSDPMAAGTDTMLQSWDSLLAYAFPPFALIPQVLAKLWPSPGAVLTLISPFWPQEWFPDLLDPLWNLLPLLDRWDLLRQPYVPRFQQNLHVLWLHAWRLSGDSSQPPDPLQRRLVDSAGVWCLVSFQDLLCRHVVAVFSENTTAVSYLQKQGGTFSPVLNELSKQIPRWAERKEIIILPQFVPTLCLTPIR